MQSYSNFCLPALLKQLREEELLSSQEFGQEEPLALRLQELHELLQAPARAKREADSKLRAVSRECRAWREDAERNHRRLQELEMELAGVRAEQQFLERESSQTRSALKQEQRVGQILREQNRELQQMLLEAERDCYQRLARARGQLHQSRRMHFEQSASICPAVDLSLTPTASRTLDFLSLLDISIESKPSHFPVLEKELSPASQLSCTVQPVPNQLRLDFEFIKGQLAKERKAKLDLKSQLALEKRQAAQLYKGLLRVDQQYRAKAQAEESRVQALLQELEKSQKQSKISQKELEVTKHLLQKGNQLAAEAQRQRSQLAEQLSQLTARKSTDDQQFKELMTTFLSLQSDLEAVTRQNKLLKELLAVKQKEHNSFASGIEVHLGMKELLLAEKEKTIRAYKELAEKLEGATARLRQESQEVVLAAGCDLDGVADTLEWVEERRKLGRKPIC